MKKLGSAISAIVLVGSLVGSAYALDNSGYIRKLRQLLSPKITGNSPKNSRKRGPADQKQYEWGRDRLLRPM